MVKITPEQALRQAVQLEKLGERLKARKYYQAYLRKFPRANPALAGLARVTRDAPNLPKTKAPKQVITDLEALLADARPDAALDRIETLLITHPTDARLWRIKGQAQTSNLREYLALSSLRMAAELAPRDAEIQILLGGAHQNARDFSGAHSCFLRAQQLAPDDPEALAALGNSLIDTGDKAQGIALIEQALDIDPDNVMGLRVLSENKRFTPDNPHFARLKKLVEENPNKGISLNLVLALSKAYRDIGEYEKGLNLLIRANNAKKQKCGFDMGYDRALFANIRGAEMAADQAPLDVPPADFTPIFVLGMPRSGTTLTERILGRHGMVEPAGELLQLEFALIRHFEQGNPLTPGFLQNVRDNYLREVKPLTKGRAYVVDKMPHNFRWIGVIARALPEAKIVHMDRDARAVAWSNFKTYFSTNAKGMGYSCDLGDTVEHYLLYRDVMALWRDRYPGLIMDFDYEALTQAPEARTRALLDWLGLPWDDACLSPEETRKTAKTASKNQVTKPIYTGSGEEWRLYEHYLGGVFDRLPGKVCG